MLQAHPGLMAASMPWLSGVDYKRLCTWFPYAALLLVLTRDKGSGRVTIGRDGLPRIHYWPGKHDRASMMKVSSSQHCKQHDQIDNQLELQPVFVSATPLTNLSMFQSLSRPGAASAVAGCSRAVWCKPL